MNEWELLRLHDEPCQHFDERLIHRTLMQNIPAFMDLLERFYLAWQQKKSIVRMPKKTVFTTNGLRGDFRVMPCVIDDFEGMKIKAVKVIGTNEEERVIQDKIAVGKALIINTTDNHAEGIFDVCALSSFRTAALSVLAFKHLTRADQEIIGMVGIGRIGFYTASILQQWLGRKEVLVYDTDSSRRDVFAGLFAGKMKVTGVGYNGLLQNATTVFYATTSSVPLLSADQAGNLEFISSVGADADNLSELDQSLVKGHIIVSESRQNISFGDLRRWHRAGVLHKESVLELRDMVGRSRPDKPTIFISTGTAVQDALLCRFLFDLLHH